MVQKIDVYYKLEFPTSEDVGRASDALMGFATTHEGIMAIATVAATGHKRIVMWEETLGVLKQRVLYLSEGSLNRLQQLVTHLPPAKPVPAAVLPADRALMIGDQRDWQNDD